MPHFRVFTGAPTLQELDEDSSKTSHNWQTATSLALPRFSGPFYTLPPATLASAERRISLLYENIIFDDESEEVVDSVDPINIADEQPSLGAEQSTVITWPPTADESASRLQDNSKEAASFLRPSMSVTRNNVIRSQFETQEETQETASYEYSDGESIARFPTFHFSLHRLTALSALSGKRSHISDPQSSLKVTVLVAVLEVDGPDTIRVKRGVDAGKEVSILKLILGDEDGGVCKLTAWRDIAELWGGSYPDAAAPAVKRGDIVLLQNVLVSTDASDPSLRSLTASPNLKSQMEICFRTLPRVSEDARLRPDLRLGITDSAVRKVAAVVSWFESIAGLRHD